MSDERDKLLKSFCPTADPRSEAKNYSYVESKDDLRDKYAMRSVMIGATLMRGGSSILHPRVAERICPSGDTVKNKSGCITNLAEQILLGSRPSKGSAGSLPKRIEIREDYSLNNWAGLLEGLDIKIE